jgi:predicted Zn finger-like uncharacterized protein
VKTVRCSRCLKVFTVRSTNPHANVRCPGCNTVHRLAGLTASTAGDSMLISPVKLKQMLESPRGPQAAAAHAPTEPVVLCPACKTRLYVNLRKYGGKKITCPACQHTLVVPRSREAIADEQAEESS